MIIQQSQNLPGIYSARQVYYNRNGSVVFVAHGTGTSHAMALKNCMNFIQSAQNN